jgi:uncharacterized protein YdhG (YjbR/CyaY superfamily)
VLEGKTATKEDIGELRADIKEITPALKEVVSGIKELTTTIKELIGGSVKPPEAPKSGMYG